MGETKAVQVRAEIRELAQAMERRCRESVKKIAAGEWKHANFLSEADLFGLAEHNLVQLEETNLDLTPAKALEAAADVANYLNFLRLRIAASEADTEAEYPRPDADERGPHGE